MRLFPIPRCLPPCLLLVLGLAGPAQAAEGDVRLKEEVARCVPLVYDAPRDALALADRLLALPALPLAMKIDAVSCRTSALHQLGRNDESRQAISQLQAMLRTPGLALGEYDQVQRRVAFLLLRDGRIDEGLRILEALQERSIATGNIGGQILALGHIALVHAEQLDDPEGALHYQQQALTLSGHLPRPPRPQDVTLNYNHGCTLLQLKRYDEAGRAFDRAEHIARRLSMQEALLHSIRSDRAEILRARGHRRIARSELLAVLHWQERNNPLSRVTTLQYLARIALDEGVPEQARELAEQAATVAEAGRFPGHRERLELLAEISIAQGDAAKAHGYLRRARQSDRPGMSEESLARLARMQARAAQALEPARVNALQEANRDRLLRDIALAIAALLLVGVAGLYLRTRRQQRSLRGLLASARPLLRHRDG
ncbi:MAG: hypothetical protein J0I01_17535 [Stenotrophomonas nitritireducens]|uniref:hypothetical protein n=1 Tax=Stenotrophomonas nitritireducens TaxID=83617 RepID=UPI001ACBB382|nr:hypothetical protein [Stenotrophomonas nitritireducens]MBN8794030.1 hypothetical protein [Stenotrophomonas nitritireducens]MBN8797532.1 hypothetical protein [Stenotrophomonas nitritireducens]